MKIKKYQNPSNVLENNSNITTTKPVLDNIQYGEDGVMRWKDKNGNIKTLFPVSDTEYVSLDTEGNITNKFNIDPEVVSKLKRYDAKDLDNFFANLLTFGAANELTEGAKNISKGEYLNALKNYANIAVFGPGPIGNVTRALYGLHGLLDENGIRKTGGLALGTRDDGLTGNRIVDTLASASGDVLNYLLARYGGTKPLVEDLAKAGNSTAKAYTFSRALNGDINATKLGQQNPYLAWGAPVTFGRTAEVPRITVENAAGKSVDSWEAAYTRAVNSGDVAEQQRLIKLRFSVDSPNNKYTDKLYHNTNAEFTEFDPAFIGKTDSGYYGEGFYFTPNEVDANNALGPIQKQVYVNLENPIETTSDRFISGQLLNNDGVIVRNGDEGWITLDGSSKPNPDEVMEVMINKPENIKSAAPVTYDNNGWTIPITERFHFDSQDVDIRGRGWFGKSIAQQNAQAMKQSSRILDSKGIGEANPQIAVRTGHRSLSDPDNPFQIRRARLNNKFIGDYDPSTQKLINKVKVRGQDIRNAFKQLDPSLSDDELDLAVQTAFASRRGVHVPIGDNSGRTIGGVSVVDIEETLKYLKESGIINPNADDVGTVVAHEAGHGVKVNKFARDLVKDFKNPDEFYTLVGQVLDDAKITKNEEIPFGRLMQLTDKYLKKKKLDNGITELREYLSKYPENKRKDLMKAIGRFSAGLFGAYLIQQNQKRNKNEKIN